MNQQQCQAMCDQLNELEAAKRPTPDGKDSVQTESKSALPSADFYASLPVWRVDDVPMARGAWVYHLIRDGKVVYVGMTVTGILRLAQHINDGYKKFDSFRARPCKNKWDALTNEALDIWIFEPEYNTSNARHPDYAPRQWFTQIGWLKGQTLTQYLETCESVMKCGVRHWHRKYRWPEGHPKRENYISKHVP